MDKIQIIEKLFLNIVAFSYLLLPVCFLISKNKKKELIPVTISLYGVICCCFIYFFKDIPKEISVYFQTSYTFFEYAVFTFIFWFNFKQDKIKRLIIIFSLLFFAFQLFYVLSGNIKRLDSVPIGIETILLLIYIIYFFYTFSKRLNNFYIYNHYVFWFAVGILIYLGGSFFFFILIDHLTKDQVTAFGNLTFLAEVIKNILFGLALFVYNRHTYESTEKNTKSIPFLDMI